jgi:hypothetical protein
VCLRLAGACALVLASACATPTGIECVRGEDCPAGWRCDVAQGACVPAGGDADVPAEDGAGACAPATCTASCRDAGYADGACVGSECRCSGVTPPDGGPDGTPEDAGVLCDPEECARDCSAFGMVGACGAEGCNCTFPGADADADVDDGGPADDGRADDGGGDGSRCAPGETWCGGICVDTATNPSHCGACGRACRRDQVCAGGVCECPPGRSECAGTCRDLASDPSHCGECGRACGPDRACSGGSCVCGEGLTDCAGTCTNVALDPNNCGRCGNVCGGGRTCGAGSCYCTGGLTDCYGTCVNTATDPSNCGRCGNVCPCGACSGGSCASGGGTASFTFPDYGDSYWIAADPYMWVAGDYFEGVRSTALACATSVSFTLYAADNLLSCDVLDLTVSINGVHVGSFSYPPGWSAWSQSFSFPAVAGPTYRIRLQVARTVATWCGSVFFAGSTSPWTLN